MTDKVKFHLSDKHHRKSITFEKGTYFTPGETGSYSIKYSKDGKDCPYIVLNESKGKRCCGLMMIEAELTQAIDYAQLINENNNSHKNLSYWQTAIMCYSRCFSSSSGRGTTLNKKHISAAKCSAKMHGEIMNLRNEYIAHAGNNDEVTYGISLLLAPLDEPREVLNVYYHRLEKMGGPTQLQNKFIEHCRQLIPHVTTLRLKAEENLLNEYRSLDINTLYRPIISIYEIRAIKLGEIKLTVSLEAGKQYPRNMADNVNDLKLRDHIAQALIKGYCEPKTTDEFQLIEPKKMGTELYVRDTLGEKVVVEDFSCQVMIKDIAIYWSYYHEVSASGELQKIVENKSYKNDFTLVEELANAPKSDVIAVVSEFDIKSHFLDEDISQVSPETGDK